MKYPVSDAITLQIVKHFDHPNSNGGPTGGQILKAWVTKNCISLYFSFLAALMALIACPILHVRSTFGADN